MSTNSSDVHSVFMYLYDCFTQPSVKYQFAALSLLTMPLVLPLCLYILRLGLQRWRSRAKVSHSDAFTYNLVVVLLLCCSNFWTLTINAEVGNKVVTAIGIYVISITYFAMVFFLIFTCIERYLAVVHPVTYLRLKSQTWTRLRDISCGFTYLLSVLQSVLYFQLEEAYTDFMWVSGLWVVLSLSVVVYCNICVVRVLRRPQPGDGANGSRSKQKAFYTISAITAMLLLKFGGDGYSALSFVIIQHLDKGQGGKEAVCDHQFAVIWFTLPSSLVLPLLFLHRNGKLRWFKTNKQQPRVKTK